MNEDRLGGEATKLGTEHAELRTRMDTVIYQRYSGLLNSYAREIKVSPQDPKMEPIRRGIRTILQVSDVGRTEHKHVVALAIIVSAVSGGAKKGTGTEVEEAREDAITRASHWLIALTERSIRARTIGGNVTAPRTLGVARTDILGALSKLPAVRNLIFPQ